MQQRRIGDRPVSAIGLGAMPLSTKTDRPSREDAVAVVHAALDAGVTLVDTADAYARDEAEFGHNESLVAEALASAGAPDVLVATKGGHTREGADWLLDGSPAYLRRACEASLRRLGVDAIGLYQFHRPDPDTPWEDSMGALRQLADDGLVQMVGISNADVAQIDVARSIVGPALVSVQNQFSPGWRSSADEVAHCAAHGLAFLPWSPFGGVTAAGSLAATAPAFAEVAAEVGVSVHQVTLAWHLAQSDAVVPIPGASRPASIQDSAAAADLRLTPEQLARLDA
ncbi:aryl-alcohol dehydrogenase-like predicted oxidoreductase [Geodermatophilus normandii]|uniref:Aryl-alcohol dehydrogenase-like predicted oxidoreductase n=1 Tax=Geodermatophilus normandii TaxID=1137989 RepID=A0A317QNP9_9ACTN|nr:aldo/keto reductase [Geodermatophilus normandii]PWW24583.1 aryl-alcohol dehydrogenase-like predicted oxidoreductase [Geodermatophilus normandii]